MSHFRLPQSQGGQQQEAEQERGHSGLRLRQGPRPRADLQGQRGGPLPGTVHKRDPVWLEDGHAVHRNQDE